MVFCRYFISQSQFTSNLSINWIPVQLGHIPLTSPSFLPVSSPRLRLRSSRGSHRLGLSEARSGFAQQSSAYLHQGSRQTSSSRPDLWELMPYKLVSEPFHIAGLWIHRSDSRDKSSHRQPGKLVFVGCDKCRHITCYLSCVHRCSNHNRIGHR